MFQILSETLFARLSEGVEGSALRGAENFYLPSLSLPTRPAPRSDPLSKRVLSFPRVKAKAPFEQVAHLFEAQTALVALGFSPFF